MVKTKFECVAKNFYHDDRYPQDDGYGIVLTVVVDGSDEEKEFFRLTPCGQITLDTISPEAAAEFEVGGLYNVSFEQYASPKPTNFITGDTE